MYITAKKRVYFTVLFENDHAQFFLAGFVAGLFGLRDTLRLDGAVGDGGLEFGGVDDAGGEDIPFGGDVNFNADLSLFAHRGVDVVDHAAGTGAVADAATMTAARAGA